MLCGLILLMFGAMPLGFGVGLWLLARRVARKHGRAPWSHLVRLPEAGVVLLAVGLTLFLPSLTVVCEQLGAGGPSKATLVATEGIDLAELGVWSLLLATVLLVASSIASMLGLLKRVTDQ